MKEEVETTLDDIDIVDEALENRLLTDDWEYSVGSWSVPHVWDHRSLQDDTEDDADATAIPTSWQVPEPNDWLNSIAGLDTDLLEDMDLSSLEALGVDSVYQIDDEATQTALSDELFEILEPFLPIVWIPPEGWVLPEGWTTPEEYGEEWDMVMKARDEFLENGTVEIGIAIKMCSISTEDRFCRAALPLPEQAYLMLLGLMVFLYYFWKMCCQRCMCKSCTGICVI